MKFITNSLLTNMTITILIICFSDRALAVETKTNVLRLKDLIQEALDNNQELKAAKFEALSKEAEIGPKGSYEDPMLTFEAMNYPSDTMSPREYGMTGNQIGLTQKIPFPGKLSKLSKAAAYEYNAKKEEFSNRQLQLVKEIKMIYFNLFLAFKKQVVLTQQRAVLKQIIATTRSRFTLGKVSQTELLNFQMEEANLSEQLLAADTNLRRMQVELQHALGHQNPIPGSIPEEIKKTALDVNKMDENAIIEKALQKNPSIKSMKFMADSAGEKQSFAKWNYLPDFEIGAAYTQRQPSPGDRGVSLVSGKIALTIPIWAFSKQSEEVKGADAEKAKADALYENEKLHIFRAIHTLVAELKEASSRLSIYEGGLLQLARQAVKTGKPAYSSGRLEYAVLLNSINSSFKTEYSYNEALVSYEAKIAELEAITGEPLGAAK